VTTKRTIDELRVIVHPDRVAMGAAAAAEAAKILRDTLTRNGSARIIVASAPSQDELIAGLAAFHGIRGEATDPESECERYAALLAYAPIDLVCMGIGENGHIAFNDPPVADFNDPKLVKVVELDEGCRNQQVNDGCFPNFDAVPARAFTLTCPALMSARHALCVVPGLRKADAVCNTLLAAAISETTPSTVLRRHPQATLHLDTDSYSLANKLQ